MITYCLGFAFTDYDNFVVLIKKNKPAWQKGLLNGVGGKIEGDETPVDAMTREFREETGVATLPHDWTRITTMKCSSDAVVHCFAARLPRDNQNVASPTDEYVALFSIYDVRNHPKVIPNLRWLIPMALHRLDNPEDNAVPHTLDHE